MITWFSDMLGFARTTGFGLVRRRPAGAPEPAARRRDRLARSDLSETPDLFNPLTWRLEYRVAGLDSLQGLEGPVIFAVNEQGVLDWQVLKAVLPARLRTTNRGVDRALTKERSIVVFSEPSRVDGGVGEFTALPAELATEHNVPIIPVAIVGTFKLNEVLRLALRRRPRISVRFGSPIYARGRSVTETTEVIQGAVGALFHSEEISWWAIQSHAPMANGEPMPRWRRLWQQTAPRPDRDRHIWKNSG
ncbi:hypothetical protein [[Pseudopropionibacterium] massiliense]|uniref:hypothetical protein n=1 Tax=[Pseudopropionibacterium] massiliense TaxID=2220000 RepID=UPI0010312D96|nr:hypothetical protein [[Pseudopropionibacterium] massiliense]